MLKKLFIFLLSLSCGLFSFAQNNNEKVDPVATGSKIGQQNIAEPLTPPSEAVNYIEESDLALEMQQAKQAEDARKANQKEKAENARKYDSFGGGITIIAMCIVIGALAILSFLFYIFGNISSWFISRKKKQLSKTKSKESQSVHHDNGPDTGEVIAAISAALAQHFATDHDMEDTILTIRRMRKSYSPWNSKIYNMRHLPEVAHNHPKLDKR